MLEDIDINNVKNYLKSLSKNYEQNFLKIENFIKSEVDKIQKLKNSQKAVIPEIDFSELDQQNIDFIENVKKRGCLIIRNVFEDKAIFELNTQIQSRENILLYVLEDRISVLRNNQIILMNVRNKIRLQYQFDKDKIIYFKE